MGSGFNYLARSARRASIQMLDRNSSEPEVTFVVPCFKGRETIGKTLECILSQGAEESFEVIVVESSQDSTAEWIQRTFPETEVVVSKVRLSPGAARNLAANQAKARITTVSNVAFG